MCQAKQGKESEYAKTNRAEMRVILKYIRTVKYRPKITFKCYKNNQFHHGWHQEKLRVNRSNTS